MKMDKKCYLLLVLCFLSIGTSDNFANYNLKHSFINSSLLVESINLESENRKDDGVDLIIEFKTNNNERIVEYENAITISENQKLVSTIREQNKKEAREMGKRLNQTLGIKEKGFQMSKYAPFAIKQYSNYNDYQKDKNNINHLFSSALVNKAFLSYSLMKDMGECTVLSNESNINISLNDAKNMIGVSNANYTGNGIKIGVIDEDYPSSVVNFPSGCIVDSYTEDYSDHTTMVCSILSGYTGIASDAELYIFGCNTRDDNDEPYSFFNAVEWLLDKNVNLINMSLWNHEQGFYDGYCAYVDYIVSHNAVSFVKSAGNQSQTKLITNPGMALNAYAVGSVDGDENVSYYSSYDVDSNYDGIIMKPTLVAPGEKITIPNIVGLCSGTSFSAPMVTGCLALLMEQFPQLISSPELAMSAIVNGAKMLPSQTSLWDSNCGAGLLNYPETVSILSDGYLLANVPSNATNGYLAGSRNFTIPAKSYVDLVFTHKINSGVTSPSTSQSSLAFSKYNIVVTDSNGLTVESSAGNSNLDLLTVYNPATTPKTMTASIYLNGSKIESDVEHSALTFYTHNHSYLHHFVNHSILMHKSYCECGEYTLESHVPNYSSSYISFGHIYAPCIYCGAIIDLGGDGPIIPTPDPSSQEPQL